MTTMKYVTSNIWIKCECESKQNDKLPLQAARAKQQNFDRMLAQERSPWIGKETKKFTLHYKQQAMLPNYAHNFDFLCSV
jgi:hypothetical protein